ncbi:MAG: class I SAM-dependent methyltransferase [Candidatus Micrarchaeota archaeon]
MAASQVSEDEEYYSLVKRAFRLLAPIYDFITILLSCVRGTVVEFTDAKVGSAILDVGTGTGAQAFAFAKKGYSVVGVDISEDMLRIAKRKNKYKSVKFLAADATKLPFGNSSFDVSCVSFVLHDMPLGIRERALKELVRVTKPAGTIVIADYALPKNKVSSFLVYNLVKLYEGRYYREFIKSDLEALLGRSGIKLKGKISVLSGVARILKGINKGGKTDA